jgi:hypothetical protein
VLGATGETETKQENIHDWLEQDGDMDFSFSLEF